MFYLLIKMNQVFQWKSSYVGLEPTNDNCVFPVEVFSVVPFTLLFVNLVAHANRQLRFDVFYPIVVFMLGVGIPSYIIFKNKKMKSLLIDIIFKKPKMHMFDFLLLLKQSYSNTVSPFNVNQ
jgi:hypothetical protein